MGDPGTIYSDDEIDCLSNSDDDTINPVATFMHESTFFDELTESDKLEEKNEKKEKNYIEHYVRNDPILDTNKLIEKVRKEESKKKNGAYDDYSSGDEEYNKNEGDAKFKAKDVTKKELKRERTEIETKRKMNKEKIEIGFEDPPPLVPGMTFLQMNLTMPILKGIETMNFEKPTPIQALTIPIALKGRDICGCAATGTGKTAAYMIPILQRLFFKPTLEALTRVLILLPTRELGIQVYEVSRRLAQFTPKITMTLIVGGLDRTMQVDELVANPDIVIATPGRLIDHLRNTESFNLSDIEVLVVDEADRILDNFFVEQLTEIVRQCCSTRQTMLFSATMTEEIKELVVMSLKKPVRIFANSNTDITQNLRQEFVRLQEDNVATRMAVLAYLLINFFREECIVFVPRKNMCHQMRIKFGLLGLKCGELHGMMRQNERLDALDKFKNKELGILFTTDVSARGLDIKGVKTIINYSVPENYKVYVHRVGRTARAGRSGRSVTIAHQYGNDYNMLRKIKKYSLYPLYERSVKKQHIETFKEKLTSIQPLIEKVLKIEEEENEKRTKELMRTAKKSEETEAVAAPRKKVKKRKKKSEDKGGDEEEATAGDKNNESAAQKEGKRAKNDVSAKQKDASNDDRTGKNKQKDERGRNNVKKKKTVKKPGDGTESIFDEDLTQLNQRSQRKISMGTIKTRYRKLCRLKRW